jgi:signal peptidase
MKQKSILKTIGEGLSIAVIVLEVIVILFLILSKASGGIPSIFGHHMYVIVSSSMSPELEIGDVIISREYEGESLAVGDVIQYVGQRDDMQGKIITHEIISVSGEGEDAVIVTQGIANLEPDPPIRGSDVVAVMQYKTVVIDKIYGAVSTTAGFVFLVMLPMVGMIVFEIISLAKDIRKEAEELKKGGEQEDEE